MQRSGDSESQHSFSSSFLLKEKKQISKCRAAYPTLKKHFLFMAQKSEVINYL
jgi:hypothetical protein